jgi:hypothetical protein
MMPSDSFAKSGLVEYNVACFKKARKAQCSAARVTASAAAAQGIASLFESKARFKDKAKK